MKMNDTTKNKPPKRKYKLATVVVLLLAPVIVLLLQWEQEPDPASEKIVREIVAIQLDRDPNELTDEDLAKITELLIMDQELSDIRLLKRFRSLQSLRLCDIHLPDTATAKWMEILTK